MTLGEVNSSIGDVEYLLGAIYKLKVCAGSLVRIFTRVHIVSGVDAS